MMVHLDGRIAYFAMTKTASTSVENALRPHCQVVFSGDHRVTHMMPRRFNRFLRPYFQAIGIDDIRLCAQIRRPVDWVESWWRYRSQPGRWADDLDTSGISFERFVQEYLDAAPKPYINIGRQRNFLTGEDGALLIDDLFRMEQMAAFADYLSNAMGVRIQIDHHNRSPRRWGHLPKALAARLDAHLDVENTLWEAAARAT